MPETTRHPLRAAATRPTAVARAAVLVGLAAGALAAAPGAALAQRADRTAAARVPADSAAVAASPTNAQLAPGTRVRISLNTLRGLRVQGTIDSVTTRAFVVDTADRRDFLIFSSGPELLAQYRTMRVGFDEIETISVSTGTSRWRGALRWGLVGAALLGTVNALTNGPEYNPTSGDMIGLAASGAAVGGLIGGSFGYLQGREGWRLIAWP